jgi:hypothetical protein
MPVSLIGSTRHRCAAAPQREQLKVLGAVVYVVQAAQLQASVAPADIAADPHLPVGLGRPCTRQQGNRTMTNIAARLAKVEKESTATLPRITGVWLIPVEPKAAAEARQLAGGLPPEPKFVSWMEDA